MKLPRKLGGCLIVAMLCLMCRFTFAASDESSTATPAESPAAPKLRIAFINPTGEGNSDFWTKLTIFMQAAAANLDVELKVYYAGSNRFQAVRLAKSIVNSKHPPDYLIHIYYRGQDHQIFNIAHEAKLKTFTINAQIPREEREKIGKPRGNYPYWIGEMVPDDQQAGYILAKHLIENAKAQGLTGNDGKVHMLAMTAADNSVIASLRNKGAIKAIESAPYAQLEQFMKVGWDKDELSLDRLDILINRYSNLSAFWAVSDSLALGISENIERFGLQPGTQAFVGGIDGTDEALAEIQKGSVSASAVGQILEGAWAIVLLHDHFHGIDFAKTHLQSQSNYQLVTQNNVEEYKKLIQETQHHKTDFRQFSKVHHPELKDYNFSFQRLIKQ